MSISGRQSTAAAIVYCAKYCFVLKAVSTDHLPVACTQFSRKVLQGILRLCLCHGTVSLCADWRLPFAIDSFSAAASLELQKRYFSMPIGLVVDC